MAILSTEWARRIESGDAKKAKHQWIAKKILPFKDQAKLTKHQIAYSGKKERPLVCELVICDLYL